MYPEEVVKPMKLELTSNGFVELSNDDDIKKLIDEVLFEKPKDPGANFILAKYLNQNGNKNKSRNLLLKILKNLDDKGPWHQIYKDELSIK